MLTYFNEEELCCPTSKEVLLHRGFGEALDELREAYDNPIPVSSACRSTEHLNWLLQRGYPASKNSLHLMVNKKHNCNTLAIDTPVGDSRTRKELIETALGLGWSVGVARTFLHLDRRDFIDLPQIVYVYG